MARLGRGGRLRCLGGMGGPRPLNKKAPLAGAGGAKVPDLTGVRRDAGLVTPSHRPGLGGGRERAGAWVVAPWLEVHCDVGAGRIGHRVGLKILFQGNVALVRGYVHASHRGE